MSTLKVNTITVNSGDSLTISNQITASTGIEIRGTDEALVVTGSANFLGNVTLGNAAADVATVTGQLTASNGLKIDAGNLVVDENATVTGQLTGSNGIAITGDSTFSQKVTVTGDLTASNGLKVDAGNLVVDENATITGQLSASSAQVAGKVEADDGGFGGDLGVSGTISTAHVSASQGVEVTGSLKLGSSDNTTGYLELSYIDHASIPTGDEDRVLLYVSGSGTNAKIYAKAGSNTQTNVGGADIANDVNNRVTTADGAAGLNGEANLTFDGSTLTVSGFASTMGVGNSTTISSDTTVPDNFNSLLYGPITISSGISLRIGSDSSVKIRDISDA